MARRNLPRRAINYLWWRLWELRQATFLRLADRVNARWGWLARRLRWPLDVWAPYRRTSLHLARGSGLGDVLMCTPALRLLKKLNPDCRLTFYTNFPSLLAGLPFLDQVRPISETPSNAIHLGYGKSTPPTRHIARIIGDQIGLDVTDVRPSCVLDRAVRVEIVSAWSFLPRPWIVLSRHASSWTPNKEWPEEHWEDLIDRLLTWASVIELGNEASSDSVRRAPRYLNLVGQLSLDQLVAAISAADLCVGPISGPTHIAAAFDIATVVIYGGYEASSCSNYEGNIDLTTDVACSPCWLREPCPIGRLCLRQIGPETVEKSLRQLWQRECGRSALGQAWLALQ